MKAYSSCPLVCFVLLVIAWFPCDASFARAEEIFYHFDFNDGALPDVLAAHASQSEPAATPSFEVTDGQLRVFDTIPAQSGVDFSPSESLTDTHLSAVFEGNSPFLTARASAPSGDPTTDYYCCLLWPGNTTDTTDVRLMIAKIIDNIVEVYAITEHLFMEGPCALEFDVTDAVDPTGTPYTYLKGRVTYDDGEKSRTLHLVDSWNFGWGGYDPLVSGQARFGASLYDSHRDAGWILDATIDDVTIRGTVVPEPAVALLLVLGAAALFRFRGRRA